MVGVMSFLLGEELLLIMIPGLPQRGVHHIGMTIPPAVLDTQICQGLRLVLQQGDLM